MNIFELTVKQKLIKEVIENNIDEFSDDQLKEALALQKLSKDDYEDKIKSYAYIVKKFEYKSKSAKEEIDRIGKIKNTYDNCVSRMKKVIAESMESTGTDKIESDTMKIYLRKNADKLNILDEDYVPKKFKVKVPDTIDKTSINNEYKKADELPSWLEKEKGKKSLIIK